MKSSAQHKLRKIEGLLEKYLENFRNLTSGSHGN